MSKIEIEHGCARGGEPYVPQVCRVAAVQDLTHDVRSLRFQTLEGKRPFDVEPGQLGMLSVLPFGECMFAITGQGEDYVEMCIKRVGFVTERIHQLRVGDQVGLRGPYGNHFPYKSCEGRNMLFIAGGIGMPPVRSFIRYVLANRDQYGRVDIVYSASTPADLVYRQELEEEWPQSDDVHVHVSVYHGDDEWKGAVAYTAPYLEQVFAEDGLSTENLAVTICGGPSLFRTCRESLENLGVAPGDIITTLEMRMKCGVGKCGRCNVGGQFICLDGPVFTQEEVNAMNKD